MQYQLYFLMLYSLHCVDQYVVFFVNSSSQDSCGKDEKQEKDIVSQVNVLKAIFLGENTVSCNVIE